MAMEKGTPRENNRKKPRNLSITSLLSINNSGGTGLSNINNDKAKHQ